MKAMIWLTFATAVVVSGISVAGSQKLIVGTSAKERLMGAWHLVEIDSPGPDGKSVPIVQPKGMLIYTPDGHMSVQLMYPKSAYVPSNKYVQEGYEASFGSYDVDAAEHVLTHQVQGEYARQAGRQRFTAPVLVHRRRPPDHHFGSAGRTLVGHLRALLIEPRTRR